MNTSSNPESKAGAKHDAYAAWRHSSYRDFVFGRLAFTIGGHMQTAAIGWQIYERLGSVMALGYVGLVQVIPVVALALPAGHLADRVNRQRLLRIGLSLYLLCSLCLASVVHWNGAPWMIYALLLLLGTARAVTIPAVGSLLPAVVPRELLGNAATWNSSLFELTGLVGPAVAGLVIAATHGTTVVFAAAASCTTAAMVFFNRLKVTQVIAPRKADTWNEVLGGLRFVLRTRLLLAAASLDMFAVLLGGATALLPAVAKDILHVGPEGFGLLRAAPSLGAVAMAFATAHLPPWRNAGRVLVASFLGFGAATIVFGLSRNYALSFCMLVLTGIFDNLNVVIRQTLVQLITPDEMRGRVSSVNFIFIGCSNELGALESGVTARWWGTAPAIVVGGFGTLLVALAIAVAVPDLRRLRRLHDLQPARVEN